MNQKIINKNNSQLCHKKLNYYNKVMGVILHKIMLIIKIILIEMVLIQEEASMMKKIKIY